MKRSLTIMSELSTIVSAGKTEVGSVEVQPARDNQLKAANCRWGGSNKSAIPFYQREIFVGLLCLKKPDKNFSAEGSFLICRKQQKSLNKKVDLSNSR